MRSVISSALPVTLHLVHKIRFADAADVPALEQLIPESVRGLQHSHYSTAQMEGALGSVFGVDRQLIRDRTYFVAEENGQLIGCGGWSKRKTLFGSDHHSVVRDDAELDPRADAARIRAFFIRPDHARRGVGRAIVEACEKAIRAAGFTQIELASTLPGEKFYQQCGYVSGTREEVPLPNGLTLGIVRMTKHLQDD
jgi:N-acetylglutamate synthase-like GNAT family acetyltransferase